MAMDIVMEAKRHKIISKMTDDDFLKGEWLSFIKEKRPDKFEIKYAAGELRIHLYSARGETDDRE